MLNVSLRHDHVRSFQDGKSIGDTSQELLDRAGAITHKNLSIQGLRGLAALFVALFHASTHSGRYFGDSGWATAFDGRFGLVGVAIFFAISGLLMADLIQRTDPWRFL